MQAEGPGDEVAAFIQSGYPEIREEEVLLKEEKKNKEG